MDSKPTGQPNPSAVEEDQSRTSSFSGLVSDAVSNTGMQGLPNAHRAKSGFRKGAWIGICVIGVAVMLWQISIAVIKYYDYPTQTTTEYVYKTNLEFPAVTICNNNPAVLTSLSNSTEASFIYSYLTEQYAVWDAEAANTSTPQFEDWYSTGNSSSYYEYEYEDGDYYSDSEGLTSDDVWYQGQEDPSFDFKEDFIALSSLLSRTEKRNLGHQLSTMIIRCQYQGKQCQSRFNNYLYGNCYTFNSGRNADGTRAKILRTNKIGPLYGFSLELYIEQSEYIPGVSDSAGIRVLIQNQTDMPFPEDNGISLRPGTQTLIGITRKDEYRVDKPHGTCRINTEQENKEKNAFIADVSFANYTTQACRKTCFQKALIVNCSCYDYTVPSDRDIEAFNGLLSNTNDSGVLPCHRDDVYALKETCIKEQTNAFLNDTLGCADTCHVPCFEVEYPYRISYSQWPSIASEGRVTSVLSEKSQEMWDLVQQYNNDTVARNQWMNQNFLKLDVYFTDLNYEVIRSSPSYDTIVLISNLGGQAGLWLGVSIIAFFELFELIIDITILIVKYCSAKMAERKQRNQVKNINGKSGLDNDTFGGNDEMLPMKVDTGATGIKSRGSHKSGFNKLTNENQEAPSTVTVGHI